MNNNILIFGGTGFLGIHVIKELLKRQYSITVADIREIPNDYHADLNFIKCDISDINQVESAFKMKKFNFVFNLAGFANLDLSVKYPLKTLSLNIIGNTNILETCVKFGVSKFIYASSAYATSDKGSFYGISKLASEKIIEEYNKKFNLKYNILRYGSVYSHRKFENNYIYSLIEETLSTNKIIHKGDGEEIREYIHADDAAKLTADVLEDKTYDNSHILLTGNDRIRRIELFEMINEMLGGKIEITCDNSGYKNHYSYTPYSFTPSLSKKLFANPHIDMGQGLLECIKSIESKIDE